MDAAVEFSPETVWQAALASIELELSRAAFNTWVKPTHLLKFTDSTFVISCINKYGRDWLEENLTFPLQKYLSNVMKTETRVRFVINDQRTDENDFIQKDKDGQANEESNPIELDIRYNSIRNILLEPGRVVRLPVYNLRWLPYVGSQIVFMVMALWQEYYLASYGKPSKGKFKVSVRAEQVCQWAGISRAQFFRIFQTDNKIEWFARKIETDHEVNKRTGRTKKSPNKYELYDSPLTPGDAEDLNSYLIAHGIQESPLSALQCALKADPKEILHYPVSLPQDHFDKMKPHYLTVHDVVRELVGHSPSGELESLTDQLADRLLAQGEFILVSWYFLKNWLPILGADAAMFVLVLRNLCYYNDETGEIRDEVWMEGGYIAIAARLGIKNPRLVANWLPARIEHGQRKEERTNCTNKEFSRRQRQQELLGLFVERIDHRMNMVGNYAWKFKVKRIDPLTPEHQAIQQAASSFLAKSTDEGIQNDLNSWISNIANDCLETVKTEPKIVLRRSDLTKDCSETLKGLFNDCFETLDLKDNDCFEMLLKILKNFKDTQKEKDTSSNQDTFDSSDNKTSQGEVVVTEKKENWSLELLLTRADKKNKLVLLEKEKSALPFVSWLIYSASQPGIQNPYSLAIAKLKENPGVGAGGPSERLAALSSGEFTRLIEHAISFYSPSNRDWQMLFREAKRDRIYLLADSLGLDWNMRRDHY